jgi:hypothetical protein
MGDLERRGRLLTQILACSLWLKQGQQTVECLWGNRKIKEEAAAKVQVMFDGILAVWLVKNLEICLVPRSLD